MAIPSLQVRALLTLLWAATLHVQAADVLQYNRDIRPILSDRCFKCHGPDKAARKANLRLDLEAEAYAPRGDSGEHAIVPGNPGQSLLIAHIFASDPEDIMPPPASHLSLTDREKNTLRLWIAQGAKYQPHWAFIPPAHGVPVPKVKDTKWPRNEIDYFVLARLEKEGIKPSKEASKERWLRRVTYDLTGLPPAPGDITAFLAKSSAGSYEEVVERLLASPHFGQRMAEPWLDAARYADSYGYQSDLLCPTWPYRDWVVDAFNRNLPYDRFLTEQLAGDLLETPTRSQRVATAFNRLHRQTNEGGSIEEEWRTEYAADRVQTFGAAMLGLTLECARCHDHKFDPITQRDFYSFMAFFNSIDEYGLYNDSEHVPTPSILLPTPTQEPALQATAEALEAARANCFKAETQADASFQNWLAHSNINADITGLAAYFNFHSLSADNRLTNEVTGTLASGPIHGNLLVPGKAGRAIQFNGDEHVVFTNQITSLRAYDQYTVAFWINLPEGLTNGVVFHRTAGTDVGFYGTEVSLESGRLFFVIKRFWPGNAIAVRSVQTIPRAQWAHVAISYDGSLDASGMRLFVNGRPFPTEVLRNHLYKDPQEPGNGIDFGARFRSAGLAGALLDELRIYNRPLAPIEIAQLFDGHSLRDAISAKDTAALRPFYVAAFDAGTAKARAARADTARAFLETRNPVQEISVMEELSEPRPTYLLARGRYDAPKTEATRVGRTTPAALLAFPPGAPRNRLGLAEWLTGPDHPLTARVAVNRLWQIFFGRGLVATPENFGMQGAPPTHPALLDWLARDFIRSRWNTKALVRKIVLSATYRQDSVLRPELRARDPDNLLLARGPAQRLSAEMVRDTALAASGLLNDSFGGPPVSPYLPGDLWRESNTMSPAYQQSVGNDLYRRSLYTVLKRTAPMPDMIAFDAPSREVCLLKRSTTTTPQQAFVLLNDPQFVEAARVLAEKCLKEGGGTDAQRIQFAFCRLTGREPDRQELELLLQLREEEAAIFRNEPERAKQLVSIGERQADTSLEMVELAAMTEVTQAILNLNATVWKR